jgi:hypothetical protein
MSDLVYCARHASIRSTLKLFQHLKRFAQELDGLDKRSPSRFEILHTTMQVLRFFNVFYIIDYGYIM